jgi:hypothetical protein
LRLPQPGGPGSRIYIPQEQSGPVIPPGTGFSYKQFRTLLCMEYFKLHGPHTKHSFLQFLYCLCSLLENVVAMSLSSVRMVVQKYTDNKLISKACFFPLQNKESRIFITLWESWFGQSSLNRYVRLWISLAIMQHSICLLRKSNKNIYDLIYSICLEGHGHI